MMGVSHLRRLDYAIFINHVVSCDRAAPTIRAHLWETSLTMPELLLLLQLLVVVPVGVAGPSILILIHKQD